MDANELWWVTMDNGFKYGAFIFKVSNLIGYSYMFGNRRYILDYFV